MKTILCFGDSNTWGCVPLTGTQPLRRYRPSQRWPGVLRRELGDGYWIVEEGLNGRTTVWGDALEPHRNGKDLLLPSLITHQPVDLAIVMLGTNDLKRRFGVDARDVAAGAGMLLDIVSARVAKPAAGAAGFGGLCVELGRGGGQRVAGTVLAWARSRIAR